MEYNESTLNTLFEKYELESINELIYEFLPKGYNIPVAFLEIRDIPLYPEKSKVTVFGYIDRYEIMKTKGKIAKIKAKLYNNNQYVYCYWTVAAQKVKNVIFGLEQNSKDQKLLQVTAKIGQFSFENGSVIKYLENPQINGVEQSNSEFNQSVIMPEPLYVLKDGFKVSQIKTAMQQIISSGALLNLNGALPKEIESSLNYPDLETSFKYVHGLLPIKSMDFTNFVNYDGYRKRLQLEKVWAIMKMGQELKNINHVSNISFSDEDFEIVKEVIGKLKFQLTGDQKKAIWLLIKSMEKKDASKALVFGDVGSGKTMVALIVSYLLYKKGYQVAILAPTSILSNQHYNEAVELFHGENVYTVHSKTKKKDKDILNAKMQKGEPAIVIGTSSVNKITFSNLALVVIDEEQKFGVKDKEVLYQKNDLSHLVLMTATPIPRTLASAMFTDYTICKIEQKPAMQKPRITNIKNLNHMDQRQINFIKNKLNNKEQILVIVPSIVSNDMVNVESARDKFAKVFQGYKIDSINGSLTSNQKDTVTENFMQGKIDILIATTMVDSGFSNKNLSFVFIENSERFGISQLHQIRGRVGRGDKQGFCFLSTLADWNSLKETTKTRLKCITESENGFELSMKDIELRGSGDVLGVEQSGSDINLNEWEKEISEIASYFKYINNISSETNS